MLKLILTGAIAVLVGVSGPCEAVTNNVTNTQVLNDGLNVLSLPTGGGTSFQDIFSFSVPGGSNSGVFAAAGLAFGGAQISSVGLYDMSTGGNSIGRTSFSSIAFGGFASGLSTGSYELVVSGLSLTGGGHLAGLGVVSSVPEPSEWAMLIAGLAILTVVAVRQRKI